MKYLTVKEVSKKWGISERRIIQLCKEERISGAIKNANAWLIPDDTAKPLDKRSKVSTYLDTEKRVMVININTKIGYELIDLLKKQGYIIEGICEEGTKKDAKKLKGIHVFETNLKDRKKLEKTIKLLGKYYNGLIFIDTEKSSEMLLKNKEWLIVQFAQKMDYESSVVLVNNLENAKYKLEKKFAQKSKNRTGFRINSLNLEIPFDKNISVYYDEIAEDVYTLFANFRNSTGIYITTDGDYLEFKENNRTEDLERGIFYRAINQHFKRLDKNNYLWCASTMLEDEWTEEPLEMQFRLLNLEVANRGVNVERIFIFKKSEIKKFKNNKTLKFYMQSNIHTMFVDYYEILEKEPKLLQILGDGWDGIDDTTLIVDLPEGNQKRGYISRNKREVKKAKECFDRLKTYAKDLREILK